MKIYPLLEKAMKEKGIKRKDLAKLLKVRYATIIDKLKGRSAFTYDEALKIKDTFFHEYDIEELFCREKNYQAS